MDTSIYLIALIIYTFMAFGLAYTISDSLITRSLREWLWQALVDTEDWVEAKEKGEDPPVPLLISLIECPACLGFWIGLVAGLGFGIYMTASLLPGAFAIVMAFYTTGTNLILAKLTRLID